jgi:DNA invertase Pin-like site-specific DNA recombinase
MEKFVAYYRISTRNQELSGLGLDAQKKAVDDFIAVRSNNAELVAPPFTETESGKHNDRPQLQKALHRARITGSKLLVAKLDRLSRNAAFLLTLRDSGVEFICCDMPDANDLTVGIMALVAQQEREAISRRTKEALSIARNRGVKLGNPNGATALLMAGKGNVDAVRTIKTNADGFASDLKDVLVDMRDDGLSLNAMSRKLNDMGIQTPRGKIWYPASVKRMLMRVEAI